MVILSSFRPFGEDPHWDRHQMLAFRSWMMCAQRVFLFGDIVPELRSNKVSFVPCEQFPRIRDMAHLAGQQRGKIVMICNGDIMVDPRILKVEMKLKLSHSLCASSRRWHFDSELTMNKAMEGASLTDAQGRDDRGRDLFMARAEVWARIAREMPEKYRIGNATWDAYLTDAFRAHWNEKFFDFSALRLVFHPHHEGRRRPYDVEIANTP
jgi:hypothetical protein